jgi:DNA-binding LytR/AlgR family response regulator
MFVCRILSLTLEGISVTSMIRQSDHMVPIIYSSGEFSHRHRVLLTRDPQMYDILPKAFTQESLLETLKASIRSHRVLIIAYLTHLHYFQQHLMHLKGIPQVAQIPCAVGIPLQRKPLPLRCLTILLWLRDPQTRLIATSTRFVKSLPKISRTSQFSRVST